MKVLGIITARGGSRGVPGKNVAKVGGREVVRYTIEAALKAEQLDRVAVTSDDSQVKAICADYEGLTFVERPAELASDTARIDAAMRHCCKALEQLDGYRPAAVALLYANVPVRADGIIDRAVEQLRQTGADSVQTMAEVGKYHPFWLYRLDGDRASKYVDNKVYRRQELPKLYVVDSAVAVVRHDVLMAAADKDDPHVFWGEDRRGLVQDADATVDIDTRRDFLWAEAALKTRGEASIGD